MLKVNLSKSELIKIYKKIETHPNILYMNVWSTEESKVALFLIHRENKTAQIRFLVVAILEYDKHIDLRSGDVDNMFEFDTDEPAGQFTVIAPDFRIRRHPDSSIQGEEYRFLIELRTFPKSLELEAKCLWCKSINLYFQEDILEDGRVKCKNCGGKIYPVKDLLYDFHS
jgi:DNA-directed RNA polymerase subunit RPC12/RpoP